MLGPSQYAVEYLMLLLQGPPAKSALEQPKASRLPMIKCSVFGVVMVRNMCIGQRNSCFGTPCAKLHLQATLPEPKSALVTEVPKAQQTLLHSERFFV